MSLRLSPKTTIDVSPVLVVLAVLLSPPPQPVKTNAVVTALSANFKESLLRASLAFVILLLRGVVGSMSSRL